MRLRQFLAVAGVLVLFGFLGFRILDLEQRVASLSEQLGTPTKIDAISNAARGVQPSSLPQRAYEQRLAALETRLDALSRHSASAMTDQGPANLSKDQAILSVVERENNRIRDVQLEWHRARWLDTREKQLETFANQLQLSPDQTAQLHKAVANEIERMVDIMKRPSFAEEPDQVAGDWEALLADTDKRAAAVLTPEQQQLWLQGRLFERRVLWPWLPDEATARK